MSTLSTLLGADGAPQEIQHGEKKYRAGPITDAVKAAWERWLQGKARASLEVVCKGMPHEAQGKAALDLAERLAGPEYSFYGPRSIEEMKGLGGIARMASLLFGIAQEEAASLMRAQPVQVLSVVLTAFKESLGGIPAAMESLAGRTSADGDTGAQASPKP